jgi:two-component system chemotaxis response regulator CheB
VKALTLGAADVISKPSSLVPGLGLKGSEDELRSKVRILGQRRKVTGLTGPTPQLLKSESRLIQRPEVLVVGTSTGGPPALIEFFKGLQKNVDVPILLVQHMPPLFTSILARTLTQETKWKCLEAQHDEELSDGEIRIAPGDFHLRITREGKLALDQSPPENYCRPAVDPLFRSAAEFFGERVLAVVLTGMGEDGRKGSQTIVQCGGNVFAQDEATSTVWGMPGAVVKAGLASYMGPVADLARQVSKAFEEGVIPRSMR